MRRVTLAAVLCLGLLGLAPVAAAESDSPLGGVSAPAQRLVGGCALYSFDYWVSPGANDWLLQVQITDAGGTNQAFAFFTGGDPLRGTGHFQLCSKNVHAPGTFTITSELDLNDGTHQTAYALPAYRFQITPAPARATTKAKKAKKAKVPKVCRKKHGKAKQRCIKRHKRHA